MIFLSISVLVFRGSSGEGQASFFNNVVKNYIEETADSFLSLEGSQSQLANASSLTLAEVESQNQGQGGPEAEINPTSVNDNSFVSYNPPNADYLDDIGVRRNQVVDYTVQPGDTLSFIASDYGVSVNSLIWANNLKGVGNINPGQVLRIPPVSGVIHKIKKGDTLPTIAKKYGVEEAKIIAFNSLPQSGQLQVDDEIIVPDGKISISTPRSGSIATSALSSNKRFSYLPNLDDLFMLPAIGYNWGRIHGRNGVDIANSCGTPIYAAADGQVATADASGWNGGFGKFIKIAHSNGTETLYAHSSKLLVSVGQSVTRGQLIMLMGTTGRSTGCHLHFEVHGAHNPLAKH